jgi:hypothetical protein
VTSEIFKTKNNKSEVKVIKLIDTQRKNRNNIMAAILRVVPRTIQEMLINNGKTRL